MRMMIAAAMLTATAPALAETRTYQLEGFERIGLAGPHDMTVVTGKAFSVRAEGALADLDRLEVKVEGGQLEIGKKRRWGGWGGDDRKVRFTVTLPRLRGASLAGSGTMAVDRVGGADFSGEVAGSGVLNVAALEARKVSFSLAGSGSATAAGSCDTADYNIAGSGSVRAPGLRCERLDVSIAGSGGVDAFARRSADVSIMGSGDVRIAGGAKCQVNKMGSGTVRCG